MSPNVPRYSEHDEAPWREREPEALGGRPLEGVRRAPAAAHAPPPPPPPARARAPSLAARMRAVSLAAAPALAARLRRQSRAAKALPTASRAPNPAGPSLQEQLAARMQARAARAEAPGAPGGRAAGEPGTRDAPAAAPSLQEQAAAAARARGARALGGAGAGTSDRPPGAPAPGDLQHRCRHALSGCGSRRPLQARRGRAGVLHCPEHWRFLRPHRSMRARLPRRPAAAAGAQGSTRRRRRRRRRRCRTSCVPGLPLGQGAPRAPRPRGMSRTLRCSSAAQQELGRRARAAGVRQRPCRRRNYGPGCWRGRSMPATAGLRTRPPRRLTVARLTPVDRAPRAGAARHCKTSCGPGFWPERRARTWRRPRRKQAEPAATQAWLAGAPLLRGCAGRSSWQCRRPSSPCRARRAWRPARACSMQPWGCLPRGREQRIARCLTLSERESGLWRVRAACSPAPICVSA